MKKISLFFSFVVVVSILLAACQPAATPVVEPTAVIQKVEFTAAPVQPTSAPVVEATAVPEPTKPPEKEVDTEAKVVVGMETIIENLDWMTNSTLNSFSIWEQLYDRLVDLDDKVVLQPMVGKEWSISEDGKVWTFKLRDDVKFWDGTPLTAKDVVYTFDRMQIPDYNIGNTTYMNSQFNYEKSVAVDDYTLEIYTKDPVPALLYTLEGINILPEHVYSKLTPEEAGSVTIMGSGSFVFKEFKKDDLVTLERNDNYWGKKSQIKTLIYRQIAEPGTRIAELETGGVDVIQSVPMDQFDSVDALPNAHVTAISNGCRQYLGFNLYNNPTYQDKRVRQALNYAVDWEVINQAIFKGAAPRLPIHVNKPWQNENLKAYEFDPAKVESLLTEAGYAKDADGVWAKDGKKLAPSIMIYYPKGSERDLVLLSLTDQFKKQGIPAEPFYLERSAAFEKLDKREIDDMFFIGSCTSYEGQGDISDLQADSGSNYGRWNNPEFEALYKDLLKEFDLAKRKELLDKMQVIVNEEAPMISLWIRIDVWGISDKLDWKPNPTGLAVLTGAVKYK